MRTELADRIGLTAALSEAMAPTRERRSAHDPGCVLRDLAVAIADGGVAFTAGWHSRTVSPVRLASCASC